MTRRANQKESKQNIDLWFTNTKKSDTIGLWSCGQAVENGEGQKGCGRMREELLQRLIENRGRYISGGLLCQEFGVTRAAVWKQIKGLQKDGFVIDAMPRVGYRIRQMPDMVEPALIRQHLKTRYLGRTIRFYRAVDSTNEKAKQMAVGPAPHGVLVVAEQQRKGRGRLGRDWFSPDRSGVYMTLLLRPDLQSEEVAKLTMMAAVAIANVLQQMGCRVGIKWPNDVLINDAKVCGILTEMSGTMDRADYVLLGIGINVNLRMEQFPAEIANMATSLQVALGREVSRAKLIAEVLNEFERLYEDFLLTRDFKPVMEDYRRLSLTLGRHVRMVGRGTEYTGTALYFDEDGALVILCQDGERRRVMSGEVSVRGLMGYV